MAFEPVPFSSPFSSPKNDLLQQLLDLNFDVAGLIERGEAVTAPGVPKG